MSWVAVGVAGASALMGGMAAKEKAKTQKAQNLAAAEQTRNSPWTNMGAGQLQSGAPSVAAGALQGGLGGYMQGQKINETYQANKALDKLKTEKAAAPADALAESYRQEMLRKKEEDAKKILR